MSKCNIDELKSVLSSLSSLESKLDNLDIGKSERSPVDLSELSDVVENDAKNTEYVELVKKINNNKTIDTSDSVKKAARNLCCCYTRFGKIEKKILDHSHDKSITAQVNSRFFYYKIKTSKI